MSIVSKIFFLAALLVVHGAAQGRVEGHGTARRFISLKYRFSMAVPVGWGVSAALDTPVFFHAPTSERFVQAAIPPGGAVIMTMPHDTVSGAGRSATTPDVWALDDTHAFASDSPLIEAFHMPSASGASRAVICSYDETAFSPNQHAQHSVSIFWEFGRKLFAARLDYNANDSHGPAFEKTFFQTVRSIRPLDKP